MRCEGTRPSIETTLIKHARVNREPGVDRFGEDPPKITTFGFSAAMLVFSAAGNQSDARRRVGWVVGLWAKSKRISERGGRLRWDLEARERGRVMSKDVLATSPR